MVVYYAMLHRSKGCLQYCSDEENSEQCSVSQFSVMIRLRKLT